MNDNVIELRPAKVERHLRGEAKCLTCKHEWDAVAPVGVSWLECPFCGLERGSFRYHVMAAEGIDRWTCACGADVFYLAYEKGHGTYACCTGCGSRHEGF